MTLQEALTKAREGGYPHDFQHRELHIRIGVVGLHAFSTIHVDEIFLDTEFWYALGRTLGWHHERVWRRQWQRCIDHLARGNTPESFFTHL
jgi:hypothetical protein